MKPQELKAMLENHSKHHIDNFGNVYLKVKRGKRYTWGDAPVCNILEMAEELERLRILSPISPADVMQDGQDIDARELVKEAILYAFRNKRK